MSLETIKQLAEQLVELSYKKSSEKEINKTLLELRKQIILERKNNV